jgi:hypothetical protein
MRIIDGAGDRAAVLRSVLHDSLKAVLPPGARVSVIAFGGRTTPAALADSFGLQDAVTDIAGGIRALRAEHERSPLRAALLISDGAATAGDSPLGGADLPFPLHTIGLGDSVEPRDVAITAVAANDLVYAGTPTPVSIRVKSSGFAGESVTVRLTDGRTDLASTTLRLSPGMHEHAVDLTYTPGAPGAQRMRAVVSSLPGELTAANNVHPFTVRVLKSRLQILLLAGAPGPDLASIRQGLSEERDFAVHSFTGRPGGGFFEGSPSAFLLDSIDCVVTIGYPTIFTRPAEVEALAELFERKSVPILFMGGTGIDPGRLQTIERYLPMTLASVERSEQLVFARPDPGHRSHQVFAGEVEGALPRLPPVYRSASTFTVRPGAVVLAHAAVRGITLPDPLIVARTIGRQRALAVLAHGIWRWRLMAQGDPSTAHFLNAFLSNAVRWLTTPEDLHRVRARPLREEYGEGEPVEFEAQVYDAGARPLDGAQARVRATGNGRVAESVLVPAGNGRYTGTLEGLPAGDYRFEALASADSAALGQDDGGFTVGAWTQEMIDTRMNAPLLRQIAARSGGFFAVPGTLGSLTRVLHASAIATPDEMVEHRAVELSRSEVLLALLVILLGAEWFLRKRNGML